MRSKKMKLAAINRNRYLAMLFFLVIGLSACGEKTTPTEASVRRTESETKTESVRESETESVTVSEPDLQEMREIVRTFEPSVLSWLNIKYSGSETYKNSIVELIESELCYDWKFWYQDYNGERLQRLDAGTEEYLSPWLRKEVIFYRPESEESVEQVLDVMTTALWEPLKEASDERPYRIIEYRLGELEITQVGEELWAIDTLVGYWNYEGVELPGTMEDYINVCPESLEEDGLMPFPLQGGHGAFVYLLMEEDGVYRLQKASAMLELWGK